MERVEQRLASWKAKYLSSGSRISLIQSALANLPIYFMSIFKCQASIIKRLEKLQRDFLWQGQSNKKFHLVGWNSVCKPKEGGLGFRTFLKQMNQALLGKCLWRLWGNMDSLWREIIIAKYGVRRNGWDITGSSYK